MSVESISKTRRATSSIRKLPRLHVSDPYLERLLTDEEELLYILTIRNEIIENALDECFKSYMKDQSVRFLTDCLHTAYIDVINCAFMRYDATLIDTSLDLWQTDVQFQPLAPDNYSEFSVPFETDIETQVVTKPSTKYSSMSMTMASLADIPDHTYDAVFLEDVAQEVEQSIESSQPFDDQYESVSMFESASCVREQEERRHMQTPSTSELYEEIASEASFFTGLAEAQQNYLPPIEQIRCDYQLQKTGDLSAEKSLLPIFRHTKKSFAGGLPPLRSKAKFKSGDKSTVKIEKSLGSLEKILHNASVTKNLQSKDWESTPKTEKLDNADKDERSKKEKKVDIVI